MHSIRYAGPTGRQRFRTGLLAMLFVLSGSISVVAPARAAGQDWLAFAPIGDPTATFGANDIVRIDGRITFTKNCPDGGVDDWVYATTDVYIVEPGVIPGMALEDVTGAMPNTIIAGSSAFIEEVIAVTAPSGHLGEGTYDVVYDACQDGKYEAGIDTVFPAAISVTLPQVLPAASDAIGAMKRESAVEWTTWLATRYAMQKLFDLADKAIKLQCEIGNSIGCAMKKLDYFDPIKKKFLALLLNQANHYRAIAQDPPDADFEQATRVAVEAVERDHSDAAASNATADALAPFAREVGLTEALLHAVERYQGAVAAGDARWALVHAREAQNLADVLARIAPASAEGLQVLRDALNADPVISDAVDTSTTLVRRINSSGFTAAERRALLNAGRSATAIAQIESDLRFAAQAGMILDDLIADIDETIAGHQDTAEAAARGADKWAAVAAAIEGGPHAPDASPTAAAGGPYTAAEGVSLALAGAATGSIDSAGWDLDGDADFNDANGLDPTVSFSTAGTHLIGLRIVAGSQESISYAIVDVADADQAPILSAPVPAARSVTLTVGQAVEFSIAAADPQGLPTGRSWTLDGDLVTMDDSMPFAPDLEHVGHHVVEVTVSDGSDSGGTTRRAWDVYVLAPDGDSDGWTATPDCDDTDSAVHPGANERFGNGIDDDCDAGTPDGPPGGLTGSMWSWGSNQNGSIGNGTVSSTPTFTPVPIPNLDTVVQVESSERGGFAVLDTGEVRGWGVNGLGELGIGTIGSISSVPVSPRVVGGDAGNLTGVTQLSAGGGNVHVVARRTDGSVVSWGDNGQRQIGDGSTVTSRPYPVQVLSAADGTPLTGVKAVEAGYVESYALLDDGTVRAWGQIRCDGGSSIRIEPYPIELDLLGGDVKQMSGGNQWTMFLKKDGTVLSCGALSPVAGRPIPTVQSVYVPGQVTGFGPGSGAIDIAAGFEGGLILKDDGTVWTWGYNANGSLNVIGVPGGHSAPAPVQVPLPPGPPVIDIDMDNACHALALRADGSLLSWGCDVFGQVGDGPDIMPVGTPTVIPIPGQKVYAVSNSGWNSLVLTRPADDPDWERPATWVTASIADATVGEGGGGSATVTISAALPQDVTVAWSTAEGTAGPDDVELTSGTVTIPAGQTTASIALPVKNDDIDEADEAFSIVLDQLSNGIRFARQQATGTIEDDDAAPTVSVEAASITEGSGGLTDAVVHVHLSRATDRLVSVGVSTANGTATAPSDYAALVATVTFAPGQDVADIHVAVTGDTAVEPAEDVTVTLANPVGATLGDATATLAIEDDDALSLVVSAPEVTEGDAGTTPATFRVALEPAPPAGTTVAVDFAVEGLSATIPDDVYARSGTLEFAPGDGPKEVVVDVVGDDASEGPEAFRLVLSGANASDGRPILPGDSLPGLILDDDAEAPPPPPPPANAAPVVDAGPSTGGAEGTAIVLDATATDPDAGDTLTTLWTYQAGGDVDAGATCTFADASAVDASLTCTDDGTYTATLEVSDPAGHTVSDEVTVVVANEDPSVDITAPANLASVGVGATVKLSAVLADPGSADTHTCTVEWGDGSTGNGVVANGRCTGSHAYADPAVPTIRVTANDDDTGTGDDEIFLVITSPASKVTGGGWIGVDGSRTSFGFVAAPEGDGFAGEIQVRAAEHRFHGHEVTGLTAARPSATWSGTGRWDGTDGFTYLVSVVDNRNGGDKKGGPDTISIEIRDPSGAVVFAASGLLQGGNLRVG